MGSGSSRNPSGRMFRTVLLLLPLLLAVAAAVAAVPAERTQERIFLHMLGNLLSGEETTTTVGPSTTKATLYGDLVNIWNMLFGEDSTTTELATTTTTKCGGIFGGGLGLGCPQ